MAEDPRRTIALGEPNPPPPRTARRTTPRRRRALCSTSAATRQNRRVAVSANCADPSTERKPGDHPCHRRRDPSPQFCPCGHPSAPPWRTPHHRRIPIIIDPPRSITPPARVSATQHAPAQCCRRTTQRHSRPPTRLPSNHLRHHNFCIDRGLPELLRCAHRAALRPVVCLLAVRKALTSLHLRRPVGRSCHAVQPE